MTPTTISHYQVRGELGRGGMGVVYKADDTKLARTVALKVLPTHALTSEDDRARFYREARAAASLHHPHIATVFEIDEHEGQPFIAMEYIDGQCLDDRIADGLLTLETAVGIAIQVAEALKAAHDKNVVHRDVKSGNVMLTSDGVAKVLDFGLAKTAASTKLTQRGSTLGTIAYMSPEQARGEDVDHRSDLWSLGAVLYEMVSGKLPFSGDFEQAVVYSILNEDQTPLTAIRTGVPMGLEWIVTKLLAKKAGERYQNAADLLVDLRTVDLDTVGTSRVSAKSVPAAPVRTGQTSTGTGGIFKLALGFIAGLILMTGVWFLMPTSDDAFVETSVKRFDISLPSSGSLSGADISPDGSKIVYADAINTVDNVHVLDLATGENRIIASSGGTVLVSISPDGSWILLTKGLTIERVPFSGGSPLLVVSAQEGTPRAGWAPDGWVVFENHQAIWRASTTTGEVAPFTFLDTLSGEIDHDWPQALPDGRTIVATIEYETAPSAIGLWDFDTGERKATIPIPGYRVKYIPTGHLIFVLSAQSGNLVVLPFDLSTLSVTGAPIPVLPNVSTAVTAASDGGTLLTAGRQGTEGILANATRLQLLTFPSSLSPLAFEPTLYRNFELSPDGRRLVASIEGVERTGTGGVVTRGQDIWVLDLEGQTQRQLTFGGSGRSPVWIANGDSVAYVEDRPMGNAVVKRASDGSGGVEFVMDANARIVDIDISSDGSHIAYVVGEFDGGVTRMMVQDLRTREVVDLSAKQDANIRRPRFSPDGRFVAYESDQRSWVRDVQGTSVPIFFGQSIGPRWSPDGTTMYGRADPDVVFATPVWLNPTFSYDQESTPVGYEFGPIDQFDVFSDGQAGIFNLPTLTTIRETQTVTGSPDSTVTVRVTVNWFETLR